MYLTRKTVLKKEMNTKVYKHQYTEFEINGCKKKQNLSPNLFNLFIESFTIILKEKTKGLKINGQSIQFIWFVSDIAFVADSEDI